VLRQESREREAQLAENEENR